ncbi:MarR family transcriptional regulator [Streptomyces arboris]|uniref:MarR family transcriptional regulator n=1 Tax=Streptomyces arboris TaxID=2600619 RepID=UPI00178C500E|nr:MarR family transcriptional regulator [Streptomyces arboris]
MGKPPHNAYLATERARFTGGTEHTPAPEPPADASVDAPPPPPWVPEEPPPPGHEHPDAEAAGAQVPEPPHAPALSPAYQALAQLGQVDRRVGLSADDCAALEGLAAAWFERDVSSEYVIHALTSGLPLTVDSPAGFVRRRLETKIPPHQPTAGPTQPPPPGAPAPRVLVECAECGAPGRPEALPDGLCRPCRSESTESTDAPEGRTQDDGRPGQREIGAYVSEIRNRLRLP